MLTKATSQKITFMVEILPEQEQQLAYELIKRLVLAWDPDFTKTTPEEALDIAEARREYENGETVNLKDIN